MDPSTEIRKLPSGPLHKLVQILEIDHMWKELMARVPNADCPSKPKYSTEHIRMIEAAGREYHKPCAEIFLEEWGTSGRIRPTLQTLQDALVQSELLRAADFVAVQLLGGDYPERPTRGPAAAIDVSTNVVEELIPRIQGQGILVEEFNLVNGIKETAEAEENVERQGEVTIAEAVNHNVNVAQGFPTDRGVSHDTEHLPMRSHLNTQLPHYPYTELEMFTDNFSNLPLTDNGRKLGTGAFGTVYLAVFPTQQKVAVKKLNKDAVNAEKQFKNEVEVLSRYHHPNLLPLLGYSCDGPGYCLVYEYMSNGSLQDRLECQNSTSPLHWKLRTNVARKTARGIVHLHTAYAKPLIHRDVKSANILLDGNFEAKLGDFGLVRLGSSAQRSQSVAQTNTVVGTSAYMASEAWRGDISVKMDTFSFGVVLLELLTGLPPFDEEREGCDLVTHVQEKCDDVSIIPLLDTKAGDWGEAHIVAEQLYLLAQDCLQEKKRRPIMESVLSSLEGIGS